MDATLIVQRSGHEKVLNVQPHADVPAKATGVGIQLARPAAPPAPRAPAMGAMGAMPPYRPPMQARPAAPPPVQTGGGGGVTEEELLDTMEEFANPIKKGSGDGGEDDGGGGEEYYSDEEGGEDDQGSSGQDGGSEGGGEYEEDDDQPMPPPQGATGGGGGFAYETHAAPEQPSEGYRSIEEEKSDIIFKLTRLQRQGVKGLRAFTPYSDIRDMRTELTRIRTELELERSVKFQRKILMAIVSALEWGNGKFNPFDLELDGWSEQMHQSVQTGAEYDGVFEELYFKYRGKVSTPPEVRLLLMVGGSAMMFHMTKAMMKSALLPNLGDMMRQNPEFMQSMMRAAAPSAAQPQFDEPAQQQQQPGQRREMRGPGLDIGGLAGGLGGLAGGLGGGGGLGGLMGGLMGNMNAAPGGMGGSGLPGMAGPSATQVGPISVPAPPPPNPALTPMSTRGHKRQAPVPPPMEDDDVSERLSDVVSDDLGSIPDDLSVDGGMSTDSDDRPKNVRVAVPPGGGRRGGGGKRQKTAKKVITI